MKGLRVLSDDTVEVQIKDCKGDEDHVELEISLDGKTIYISHPDFTAKIKIKRLEAALSLLKVLYVARVTEDIRNKLFRVLRSWRADDELF